jgi:hypothetical protein
MHLTSRLLPLIGLAASLRAEAPPTDTLRYAHRASAMLGPAIWKRVIVVQNSAATSRYPRSMGAVVFEMGGILWFYASVDGTQSLSQRLGQLDADKAGLGTLLIGIDPGFTHWEVAPDDAVEGATGSVPPNACFLECIQLLRERLASGAVVIEPRLLSYYVSVRGGILGHTVLYFRTMEGPMVIDPRFPKRRIRIRTAHVEDAKRVADFLRNDISNARWVPTFADVFAREAGIRDSMVAMEGGAAGR